MPTIVAHHLHCRSADAAIVSAACCCRSGMPGTKKFDVEQIFLSKRSVGGVGLGSSGSKSVVTT